MGEIPCETGYMQIFIDINTFFCYCHSMENIYRYSSVHHSSGLAFEAYPPMAYNTLR
jgi:hypothetical protein